MVRYFLCIFLITYCHSMPLPNNSIPQFMLSNSLKNFMTLDTETIGTVLLLFSGVGDKTCKEAFTGMLKKPFGNEQASNFLLYSGKRINGMGDYLSCKKSTQSYYLLGGMLSSFLFLRVGLCLPRGPRCKRRPLYLICARTARGHRKRSFEKLV